MSHNWIAVYAPASISNLGAGFDVIGVALDSPGDIAAARRTKEPGVRFTLEMPSAGYTLKTKNVAAYVAGLLVEEFKPTFGIELVLRKKMPIGSGLGSSAASGVAAAVAVNALLRKPLLKTDLLRFVVEGERFTSGAAHADNAAPSLLGGAVLIRSYYPLDVVPLPVKKPVWWVVVHPDLVVMTKEAREVLPKEVALGTAVRQWGNVGGLVAGLLNGDPALIGRSMEDVIIEPARAPLVNGFAEVQKAALNAGAYGCTLSGSGPSMLAVAASKADGMKIGHAMMAAFLQHAGVGSTLYLSRTNKAGAQVTQS